MVQLFLSLFFFFPKFFKQIPDTSIYIIKVLSAYAIRRKDVNDIPEGPHDYFVAEEKTVNHIAQVVVVGWGIGFKLNGYNSPCLPDVLNLGMAFDSVRKSGVGFGYPFSGGGAFICKHKVEAG